MMRAGAVLLVLASACAWSRVHHGGGDDDSGTGADAATYDAAVGASDAPPAADAGAATIDAATDVACTGGAETVAEWDYVGQAPVALYEVRPELAIDEAHGLHVYYNADLTSVGHAYRPAGGAWSHAMLAAGVGGYGAIAVDAQGVEHICYVQAAVGGQGPLVCGTATPGGALAGGVVDPAKSYAVSLAADGGGGYLASHGRQDGLWLEHLAAGGAVTHEPVVSTWTVNSSLAIDPAGGQHLAYVEYVFYPSAEHVHYRERAPGGSWGPERVIQNATMSPRGLAIDAAGGAHLSYITFVGPQQRYAERAPGGVWTDQPVTDGPGYTWVEPQVVAMSDDTARIAYPLRDNNAKSVRLHMGVTAGGAVTVQDLMAIPYAPYDGAVAIARDGNDLHLVFETYSSASATTVHHVLTHVTLCGPPASH